jgi:hypothetical protein
MAIRLGKGSYHYQTEGVSEQTAEARKMFLKVLSGRKFDTFYDLARLVNYNLLPPEASQIDSRTINYYLLLQMSDKSTRKNLPSHLTGTPIFHFLNYFAEVKRLDQNQELIKKLPETYGNSYYSKLVLERIIPNWEELKTDENAATFCQQVENWAKQNNLYEDWILDFIVKLFRNLLDTPENELFGFTKRYSEDLKEGKNIDHCFETIYEEAIKTAFQTSIYGIVEDDKLFRICVKDTENQPHFKYRWKGFEFNGTLWLLIYDSRTKFNNEMTEKFEQRKKMLYEQHKQFCYQSIISDFTNYLNSYCDQVLSEIEHGKPEEYLEPHKKSFIELKSWFPSKLSRDEYIEDTVSEMEAAIIDLKKQVKGLKFVTKTHFKIKLKEYCDNIEKNRPSDLVKTPQKYGGYKHFEWLVDYQMPPTKSYTEIKIKNNVDLKTVREGIKNAAQLIGLNLRKALHTGRRKGSKTITKTYAHIVRHKKI